MWPFRARAEYPELEERLAKAERDLQQLADDYKRQFRELDHDMDSLWDKVKHWSGRMSKRAAQSAEPTAGAATEDRAASAAPATATSDEWQARILARRKARALPQG